MADNVASLPTDESAPTHPELKMVDYLFEKDGSQKKIGGLMYEFKSAIFAAALFVVLSIPWVDTILQQFIGVAANPVVRMIIKAIMFMIIFYFVNNFWIIKKKN